MSRFAVLVTALLIAALCSVNAFAPIRTSRVTRVILSESSTDDDVTMTPLAPPTFLSRGVSVDQDGQSNVWALEPKVEIENKSSEEKTTSALLAFGGVAAFTAVAAVVLTNLPDPNQF